MDNPKPRAVTETGRRKILNLIWKCGFRSIAKISDNTPSPRIHNKVSIHMEKRISLCNLNRLQIGSGKAVSVENFQRSGKGDRPQRITAPKRKFCDLPKF
jgi:hypothetical protein